MTWKMTLTAAKREARHPEGSKHEEHRSKYTTLRLLVWMCIHKSSNLLSKRALVGFLSTTTILASENITTHCALHRRGHLGHPSVFGVNLSRQNPPQFGR